MSEAMPSPEESRTIDRLCDTFETEWQTGRRPTIESFLVRVAPSLRPRLLVDLLALDVELRLRSGERPAPAEYQQRFPQDAAAIVAAFARSVAGIQASETVCYAGPTLTLQVVEGPSQGQTYTFAGSQSFTLGRSRKAQLAIPDSYLSRFHFLVEANPPRYRLVDLQSRNGTSVNGQRVLEPIELHDGDTIQAGQTCLCVHSSLPSAVGDDDLTTTSIFEATPVGQGTTIQSDPERTFPPRPEPPQVLTPAPTVTQIKGYRIERVLGRGGMGIVFLARREEDDRAVALKTIRPAVTDQPRLVKRFLREANILCQLRHHHIVNFLEAGEADSVLYLAMEYIDGIDAARLVAQQGRLGVLDALRMVCQLLSALKYAHEKKFVHRDIKPANMLVAQENGKKTVKLADFGLARVYQESQLSGLTVMGDVGGTVAFMPPEQITQFRQVMPAADQYSAAATLYNLLTGDYLFDFKSAPGQALRLIQKEEPIPIRQRRPELPEKLAQVIHRALAKEPEARFPDIQAFREALVPFAQ